MINFIKEEFSIKDLENLTGIKSHTIRIWEQRYNLLTPKRSETNIRTYSVSDLRKILNINVLNSNGYKISKISKLNDDEIASILSESIKSENAFFDQLVNDFILSMLSFNKNQFFKTYEQARENNNFESVFISVIIPLLEKIGLLWQTNSIQSAHEFFISNLIRQKIYLEIDKLNANASKESHLYVIFLPINEIHDLGSLFVYYKLLSKSKNVIYLGPNINETTLSVLAENDLNKSTFIAYATVQPLTNQIPYFISNITSILNKKDKLIILGQKVKEFQEVENLDKRIKLATNLDHLDKLIS